MKFLIERDDDGLKYYLSEKIGRDFGSPGSGWSNKEDATKYDSKEAATEALGTVVPMMLRPFCKVVEHG